jgi:pimeloyl-ACP methyl ester carboxylesterase
MILNKLFHRKIARVIRTKNITFGSHGLKLRGKIIFPAAASPSYPVPGVLLCHGFGSGQNAMKPSAKMLAERGIATMIFDFRGHCTSEGVVDGKMVDDIIDAWKVLRDYPEVDRARMGIAGHSLGAMSAIMATEKLDSPNVLVALSCPPQIERNMFAIPEDFGHWGSKHPHVITEYPRQGAFPWLKGLGALGCRAWMYFFGYNVRVDLAKFAESALEMKMKHVLKNLENCSKLFVFCEGDTVTPYNQSVLVYESASDPKSMIYSKGGFHTTPIMRGNLRTQWTNWIADKLTR